MFTLEELRVKNKVIAFNTAESALNFLYQTKEEPFLIISDINMPKMDVIAFKKRIRAPFSTAEVFLLYSFRLVPTYFPKLVD